jgi:phosphoribosyl-ATP pyrophosphohydrolase
MTNDTLDQLMAEIHRRAAEMPPGSYTTQLISGGVEKMGAKIMEEAEEVVEAAGESDGNEHLVYEACDLIYHLWVLLGSRGIQVDDLRRELDRRSGMSGLEEKRRRSQS